MIGKNIAKYRKKLKLSEAELAKKLDVTPKTITKWEEESKEPTASELKKLAKIFGITIDELCGKKPKVESNNEVSNQPKGEKCELCGKIIHDPNDIIKDNKIYTDENGKKKNEKHLYCVDCFKRLQEERKEGILFVSKRIRNKSFIISGIVAGIVLITYIILSIVLSNTMFTLIGLISIPLFTYLSCIILDNIYLFDILLSLYTFGFVTIPVKLFTIKKKKKKIKKIVKVLKIIGGFFAAIAVVAAATVITTLTSIVGLIASLPCYPIALTRNINKPLECGYKYE